MQATNTDTITRLRRDILLLQGFKPAAAGKVDFGLGPINAAFPDATLPLGAIHEFLCTEIEDTAATSGFIAGLLSTLMQSSGAAIWISPGRMLFPPALKLFGINPDRVVFVDLQKETEVLWVMEEALKCGGLAAVIGEMPDISFTASRRLQLAVEQSRVTGFIVRRRSHKANVTACVTQWKIRPIASETEEGLPGIGFPRWKVELLKVRNGKPGTWNMEWAAGRFSPVFQKATSMPLVQIKQTG